MRVLFITPVMPSSTGNGLAMRAGLWLETLSARFDTDVAVASMFSDHESAQAFTSTRAHSITMLSGRIATAPGIPRLVPELDESSSDALHKLLLITDLVVVFRLYLAELAQESHDAGIPVLIDVDDLDWVREERLGNYQEAAEFQQYARSVLHLASVVTTASCHDAERGHEIHHSPQWMHVPNGVRGPSNSAESTGAPEIDLLFVATLGYEPNAQAADWLVREVMPQLPGVRAAIVGFSPSPTTRALAGPNVIVEANIADVTPWYQNSRACVVPIHAGAGTRTKIPEAWAHLRPVISTTIGAEGIDVSGAALIADDANSFAQACSVVLTQPTVSQELVECGVQRYRTAHSLEIAMSAANAAIDRVLATPAHGIPHPRITP